MIYDEVFEIVRYDLVTGTVEMLNAAEKIATLTDNHVRASNSLIYNGGNKIYVNYKDKIGYRKWLLYDLTTDQYDIVEGQDGMIRSLTIHNDNLWYIAADFSLCKYDLESKEKTKIMKSAQSDSVVMPETGLVAYTKDINREEIYLYNIRTQESSCIVGESWNTVYGDLSWTSARWSDSGRELFYIKYHPGLFNEATMKLMVYDVITHTSRCIYKVKMTTHEFRYVMKR